jgi:hypothetical protein
MLEKKPIPTPSHTRKQLLKVINTKYSFQRRGKEVNAIYADMQKPGIYFKWSDNVVRYVGRASHLGKRIKNNNEKLDSTDLISYITYDDQTYYVDELHYISMCYPNNYLNREVARSLEKGEKKK